MEKDEYIAYLSLRAEECGYPKEILQLIRETLMQGEIKLFDRLHRISEPEFRKWCISLSQEKKNNE